MGLHLLSSPRRRVPEAALPAAKSTPTSPPSGMLALTLMARMSALRELQPWLMRQKSSLRRVAITFLPIFIQNFLQTFLHLLSSPRRRDPEAALPTAKSTPTSPPSGMLALKLMVRMTAQTELQPWPAANSTTTSPPSGTLALKLMARKNALLKLKPWLVRQWSEPFTLTYGAI